MVPAAPYLLEPNLTEQEIAWIDEQIAGGRFATRGAAVIALLGRGLEAGRAGPARGQDDHAATIMLRVAAD